MRPGVAARCPMAKWPAVLRTLSHLLPHHATCAVSGKMPESRGRLCGCEYSPIVRKVADMMQQQTVSATACLY
eukprot:6208988-Pleurochrysis_carterae.AAC.1